MAWGHGLGVNSALPCVGSPLGSHHSALRVLSVAGMTVLEPCVLGDSMSCCVPKFRAMQIQVQSSPLLLLEGPLGERARVWRDRGGRGRSAARRVLLRQEGAGHSHSPPHRKRPRRPGTVQARGGGRAFLCSQRERERKRPKFTN